MSGNEPTKRQDSEFSSSPPATVGEMNRADPYLDQT